MQPANGDRMITIVFIIIVEMTEVLDRRHGTANKQKKIPLSSKQTVTVPAPLSGCGVLTLYTYPGASLTKTTSPNTPHPR